MMSKNQLAIGQRVRIMADARPSRYPIIGKVGIIRVFNSGRATLCWDVRLDESLPDGRRDLAFSGYELEALTDAAAATSGRGAD